MAITAARRGADGNEHRIGPGDGAGEIGGKGEPSGGDVARHQMV